MHLFEITDYIVTARVLRGERVIANQLAIIIDGREIRISVAVISDRADWTLYKPDISITLDLRWPG